MYHMKESKYSSSLTLCVFILLLKVGLWQELGVEGGAQNTVSGKFKGFMCEGLQPKPFGKIFVDYF